MDGIPLYGSDGRAINSKSAALNIEVPLRNGRNSIELFATDEDKINSKRQLFEVNYKAQPTKPVLHLVAVGISDYKFIDDLTYAEKDAMDLISLFDSTNTHSLIKKYELTNEAASRENLFAIKDKLVKSNVDDMVILSLAGHGVISNDLTWHFALHEFDSNFEQGFTFEDIETLFDGIPARDRLILIDACHSGEIDQEDLRLASVSNVEFGEVNFRSFPSFGEKVGGKSNLGLENSFQVMKQLFVNFKNNTGASVISSAGGVEFALENDEWSNGVFTYSFINGLESGKADTNRDGKILVSEIRDYVFQEVQNLTNGQQRPTSRNENLSNDFVIWNNK